MSETNPVEATRGPALSVSRWAAVSGALVAGAIGTPVFFWQPKALPYVALCFFGFEVSALVAGIIELTERLSWDEASPRSGLLLALLGTMISVIGLGKSGLSSADGVAFCQALGATSVAAGILAVVRKDRWAEGGAPVLLLWAMPVAFFCPQLILERPPSVSLSRSVLASLLPVFGPWATWLARLTGFPAGGGCFSLPLALELTAVVLILGGIAAYVRERWVAALSLIFFAPLVFTWVILGRGQILSCVM